MIMRIMMVIMMMMMRMMTTMMMIVSLTAALHLSLYQHSSWRLPARDFMRNVLMYE